MIIEIVENWRRAVGLPVKKLPLLPSKERLELCKSLIEEEVKELFAEIEDGNLPAIAEEGVDVFFVLKQLFDECGINMQKGVSVKATANMSKLCASKEIADLTVEYWEKQGVTATTNKLPSGFYTVLNSKGKVLKSITYKKARPSSFI